VRRGRRRKQHERHGEQQHHPANAPHSGHRIRTPIPHPRWRTQHTTIASTMRRRPNATPRQFAHRAAVLYVTLRCSP
jgi:hypothetical protein